MNGQEIYELITRSLSNELSEDEKLVLNEWRNASTENEKLFKQVVYIWENSPQPNVKEPDVDLAWEKVFSQIQAPKKKSSLYLRIAASLIFLIGLGFAISLMRSPSMLTVKTAYNEIKQVQLADGSTVWVNQNSSFTYPSSIKGDERKVQLTGEAFFEIHPDPTKPFIIETEKTITQVLGTSFDIRAYANELTEVSVRTGKVSFSDKQKTQTVYLTANDKGVLNTDGMVVKTEEFDANNITWQERKLVFNDRTVNDVAPSLERYFHVEIKIENKDILNCHFTGTFKDPKLKEVMDVICKTLQLTYEMKNKTVTVKGEGCK